MDQLQLSAEKLGSLAETTGTYTLSLDVLELIFQCQRWPSQRLSVLTGFSNPSAVKPTERVVLVNTAQIPNSAARYLG